MRWKATCAYTGTSFEGWQSQRSGNTVQDFLEARLKFIFKKSVRVYGSGRTDTGVHAKGQVFHFDADWQRANVELMRAFQVGLPAGIQVYKLKPVGSNFHARYSAKAKRYRYVLHKSYPRPWEAPYCLELKARPLDLALMQKLTKLFLGKKDFSAFSALRKGGSEPSSYVRCLRRLEVKAVGQKIYIITEADGYLYKMVRRIVGSLMAVGLGKLDKATLKELFALRTPSKLIQTAPAKGLWLEKVFY